jgi:transcriptional regulator with XRE-family HTH domain
MLKRFDPTDRYVGQRVRFFRLLKGWSQTALADRLDLTFQQVQKYEKGTNRIGSGRLSTIAALLDQPIIAFFPKPSDETKNKPSDETKNKPSDETRNKPSDETELVDTRQAMRLLNALQAIESPSLRSALTNLAEEIVQLQPRKSQAS